MPKQLTDAFSELLQAVVDRVPSIITGLLVLLLFWWASRAIGSATRRIGARAGLAGNLVVLLTRLGSFVVLVFGILATAVIVFPSFKIGDLVAAIGLSSIAIGFAFKDIFENFFAGIFLLWRQPFKVGDEIVAAGFEGTVEEITARSTRIRTYDGERAVIPNAAVYTHAVLVRTAFGKRRGKLVVGIGYPDDIERARETIHRVLAGIDGVLEDPGPWVYASELAPSSVNLTVYYWVSDSQREMLRVGDRVVTGVKLALDAAGIDMPYPHQVVLLRNDRNSSGQIM